MKKPDWIYSVCQVVTYEKLALGQYDLKVGLSGVRHDGRLPLSTDGIA